MKEIIIGSKIKIKASGLTGYVLKVVHDGYIIHLDKYNTYPAGFWYLTSEVEAA